MRQTTKYGNVQGASDGVERDAGEEAVSTRQFKVLGTMPHGREPDKIIEVKQIQVVAVEKDGMLAVKRKPNRVLLK